MIMMAVIRGVGFGGLFDEAGDTGTDCNAGRADLSMLMWNWSTSAST